MPPHPLTVPRNADDSSAESRDEISGGVGSIALRAQNVVFNSGSDKTLQDLLFYLYNGTWTDKSVLLLAGYSRWNLLGPLGVEVKGSLISYSTFN